jgi:hypothetical protein
MIRNKRNLTNIHPSKIWSEYLYPIYARDFLFQDNYEFLADKINQLFILSPEQWEVVLNEWEFKERMLASPISNNQ